MEARAQSRCHDHGLLGERIKSCCREPGTGGAGLKFGDAQTYDTLETLRERAKTLRELVEVGRFYFERPATYEDTARARFFTPAGVERLDVLIERLQALEPFTAPAIEALYRDLASALGLKLVDLAQLTRLAVTGRTASPPLFDVLALLGRDEALARLRAARAAAPAGA